MLLSETTKGQGFFRANFLSAKNEILFMFAPDRALHFLCCAKKIVEQKRPMTYNFDPDRWYDNERAVLEERKRRGELNEDAFAQALSDLDRRYEEMLDRLDGTYRIPE